MRRPTRLKITPLQICLNEKEKEAIKEAAENRQISMSEVARDLIKTLPEYKSKIGEKPCIK